MSSEKDRESAGTRPKEGFSESYKVEGTKMLLIKLRVVRNRQICQNHEVLSATCEKYVEP